MANCIRCGRKLPPFNFRKICQWCVQHEAAQRGEEDEDARQPVIAAPWVRRSSESAITLTHVIFGANVAVYLAMALSSGLVFDFAGMDLRPWGANIGRYTLSGQWWRLFTYMFVHGGLLHIGFNMWCLWDLGALCESLYGAWTYGVVYVICGVGAGVASLGWNPWVNSVGASGAIFGLAGALIASFYLGEFSVPSYAIKGTLRSLLFFAGFNIFFGTMMSGVDNAAHFGGLGVGLILGALIAVIAPQQDAPFRRVGVLLLGALLVAVAGFGVLRWRGGPAQMSRTFEALSLSDPNRRIAELQVLVQQKPDFAQGHFALGQAYFDQQKYDGAEAEFKRVVELEPENKAAQFDLGLAYLLEKRLEDAKKSFTSILSKDPQNADAHYGMGLTLANEGNYQASVDEFKKAISLGGQITGIYYELGQAYFGLNDYDDAVAAYLEGKQKEGDDADLETGLAEAYAAKGMTQQSQDARNKAVELKGAAR
jgi:membrane associated rhomboid family serine protease/cytochrome c-type biogenesis protein CcmH/NrfG